MQKKAITIIVAVFVILAIAFFSLISSKTIEAQLNYEEGKVLVNGLEVTSSVLLDEKDSIETLDDGLATVILYESVVVSLQPNTKVTIEDLKQAHPQMSQEKGETWNTVTKIVGVEDYTIKSGNTVASVRGTAFIFKTDEIVVLEGEVEYEIDGRSFSLIRKDAIERIGEAIVERKLTDEEINVLVEERERTIDQLRILREKEIAKNPKIVNSVKRIYDITDEDIKTTLEDADRGTFNIDEVEEKSPIKTKSLEKVADITREIVKINEEIDSISR